MSQPPRPCRAAFVAALLLATAAFAEAAPGYHLVDLGPGTAAYAINAAGQVAGIFGPGTPGVFQNGTWSARSDQGHGGVAYAISSTGVLVGDVQDINGFQVPTGWMADGTPFSIDPPAGGTLTHAAGVASDGTPVGTGVAAGPVDNGFVFRNGVTRFAGAMANGDFSEFHGINDAGQVAGASNKRRGGPMHAVIWRDGTWKDLGTLGGPGSWGWAINARGHVAGVSQTSRGNERAFLYDGTRMIDLTAIGGIASYGVALNRQDMVVGSMQDNQYASHAFVWKTGHMIRLDQVTDNVAGWSLTEATGINDAGVIVGNGLHDGEQRAFMLVPLGQ